MKIQVTGKGIEVGESLREYINKNVESHVTKYFKNAINAKVILRKEFHKFYVDITVNEGVSHGAFIKTSTYHNDPYHAVDAAIMHVSRNLRRYKNKIQDYNKPKSIKASQRMIAQDVEETLSGQSEHVNDGPLITEEKTVDIQFLSIAEAIMHMDLASLPALMFINIDTQQLNMVYHREDGNITWIEAPNILDKLSS